MPLYYGGQVGNTTAQVVASGKVLPVAHPSGVTVDATTYADPIAGGGAKLTTLVFAADAATLALAVTGDAYPRILLSDDFVSDGWYFGDGTIDPYNNGTRLYLGGTSGGHAGSEVDVGGLPVAVGTATDTYMAPRMSQISPRFTTTSGALSTQQFVSGAGAALNSGRDVETVTPFTGDGTNNAATCLVQLSPDGVTYSTLATISIAAALNLTGVLTDTVNARVPGGWLLKLTTSHGTLGVTTYY